MKSKINLIFSVLFITATATAFIPSAVNGHFKGSTAGERRVLQTTTGISASTGSFAGTIELVNKTLKDPKILLKSFGITLRPR